MAVVTTALSFISDYVPYERPPQPQTLWTAIPRGLLSGVVNGVALDLKPINDQQQLTCTMTLPPNFAYIMADAGLVITQNRAADWSKRCHVELTNFLRGARGIVNTFESHYPQEMLETTAAISNIAMSIRAPWPSFPIVAPDPTTPTGVVLAARNNAAAAATAGTVMAFISFWQFDLEQIRKYPINSPIPVHSR